MSQQLIKAAILASKREQPKVVVASGLLFDVLTHPDCPTVADVIESSRGGVWGNEVPDGMGYPVLRSTNMRRTKVDTTNPAWCNIGTEEAKRYTLETGDILVTKASGSTDLVGKAALFQHPGDSQTYLFSNFTLRLRPNQNRVMPEYLAWFLRSPQSLAWRGNVQQNAVGLRNLQTKEFLALNLPVPSLEVQEKVVCFLDWCDNPNCPEPLMPSFLTEQRRIVARIEEIVAKIEEACNLRQQVDNQLVTTVTAMAHRPDLSKEQKENLGWRSVQLSDVIRQVQHIETVRTDTEYPNVGIYSFGRGLFPKPAILGIATSATVLNQIRQGQFIYSRLFAFEGAYGWVPPEFDGCYVSAEYPTFECQADVRAEFLYAYFRQPSVWVKVATGSKGLGDRRQRVQPPQVLTSRILLPPIKYQDQIAGIMNRYSSQTHVRREVKEELETLLPSVLAKAFRGDL